MRVRGNGWPRALAAIVTGAAALAPAKPSAAETAVDLASYQPRCGVAVRREGTRLRLAWPIAQGEHGVLALQLRPGKPLIEELGVAGAAGAPATPLLRGVDPVTLLTVGTRDLGPQGWNAFFDNPPRRPHETFRATLRREKVRVDSRGRR